MDREIIAFLIRAKKATYAGSGTEAMPSRPNSHDLHYEEGTLKYIDTYLGGEKFAGEETVWDGRVTRPIKRLWIDTVDIKSGQRVLDVACGTGDLIAAFAKKADIQAYQKGKVLQCPDIMDKCYKIGYEAFKRLSNLKIDIMCLGTQN